MVDFLITVYGRNRVGKREGRVFTVNEINLSDKMKKAMNEFNNDVYVKIEEWR